MSSAFRAILAKSPPRGKRLPWLTVTFAVLVLCAGVMNAQEHKNKVLEKLSSGQSQQAFDGKVQSLDVKNQILNVQGLQSDDIEIFPIKKNTEVLTANGERMDLQKLQPGTNVLVYYEQKGDRRTVRQVVVLRAGPEEQKKEDKAAPPS